MRKLAIVLIACVLATGLGAAAKKSSDFSGLPADARILLAKPDVELSELGVTMVTPKPDWSRDAAGYMELHLRNKLRETPRTIIPFDRKEELEGRLAQIVRLNELIGISISTYNLGKIQLPSKSEFDWTLGDGVRELAGDSGADYALFVSGGGSWATGGRKAAAYLGAGLTVGQQQAFAWMVDLQSGKVVWFNQVIAGPRADMRQEEGAGRLIEQLFEDFPF